MNYQLLLVDDEVHAIEGVKADLDLQKLGINKLFIAYSMRQAQEVFENEVVDIILCDIEMPQGSGLELLAWVRNHYPDTAAIFLTSHADFNYAKEALQMGSIDYLLKPVLAADLENAIQKAQSAIDRNCEFNESIQSHQLWIKHHDYIIERFWLDLINHVIPSRPESIREQLKLHNIIMTDSFKFLPLLIAVQRWNKPLKRREEIILEYALRNSATEIILDNQSSGICFQLDRGLLVVILTINEESKWNDEQIHEVCTKYIQSCNQYFYCDLSCYVGEAVASHEVADSVAKLRLSNRNNVAFVNKAFVNLRELKYDNSGTLPTLLNVSTLLKIGTEDSVLQEISKIVDNLIRRGEMNADTLHRFNQDFVQVLYSFLNSRDIQANQLFSDEESKQLAEMSGRSVTDMLLWVRHTVSRALHQAEVTKKTDSVVNSVKRYISNNIDKDLPREQLAELVYLNCDYLSRIFKKETGYSISDYILMERIKVAKKLLSQTNMPISSVASSVGYTNFSHFAKMFKRSAEIGPSEYRHKHLKS